MQRYGASRDALHRPAVSMCTCSRADPLGNDCRCERPLRLRGVSASYVALTDTVVCCVGIDGVA